jgi:hypothetical protein
MNRYMLPVLILLLIPPAFSQENIFSGKVLTDQDLLVDGKTFRFSYDEPSKKTFAQNPSLNMIIDLFNCKINSFYKICIEGANMSHRNYTTYRNYYTLEVEIYEFDYGISFNSTSPGSMLQNEKQRFTFSFTNPTTIETGGFSISAKIKNFTVKNVKGCDFDGTAVSWKGTLYPSDYKSCSMDIMSHNQGTFDIIADVSYVMGFQKVSGTEKLASIEVLEDQLGVDIRHGTDVEATEAFSFNVTLSNENEEDMDVTARIGIPKGVYFMKEKAPSSFDSSTGFLKESFVLRTGNKKSYEFLLKSDNEIKNPFDIQFTYFINGIEDTVTDYILVNVTEPRPEISFIVDPKTATPGQKVTVVANTRNPSRIFELESLAASIVSKTQSPVSVQLASLKQNETYPMISNSIILPSDAYDNYTLEVQIDYTVNGRKKQASARYLIDIVNGTPPVESPQLQQPSNVQSQSGPGEVKSFGNDAESQLGLNVLDRPVDPEAISSLEGFALVLSSVQDMNTFQKIMLIFGTIIIVSVLTIFTILHRLRYKQNKRQQESIDKLRKEV